MDEVSETPAGWKGGNYAKDITKMKVLYTQVSEDWVHYIFTIFNFVFHVWKVYALPNLKMIFLNVISPKFSNAKVYFYIDVKKAELRLNYAVKIIWYIITIFIM